jgi:hypothetical protein
MANFLVPYPDICLPDPRSRLLLVLGATSWRILKADVRFIYTQPGARDPRSSLCQPGPTSPGCEEQDAGLQALSVDPRFT